MAETENNPYQDKIDKDNDRKTLAKLKAGTANQQLINAAYLGARQEPPAVMDWLNAAQSGFTSFTTALERGKAARQKEIDAMSGDIDSQIDNLTTTGFSLGENYYGAANEYTKQLREKYLAAEGDPEAQNKIKMELNVASQSIAGTKTAIEEIATAWGTDINESDLERNGLSKKQLAMIKTVTAPNGANAIWDYNENTFVWKDPSSGEIYKIKDIQDIQKQYSRDYAGKEQYIKDEQAKAEAGVTFHEDGTGEAFNPRKEMFANQKRITKENVNFYINGDFTNDGTPSFKDELPNHPDFRWDAKNNPIFDALAKVTMPDGSLKYRDVDGKDGFDIKDLATEADMADGVFSDEEKQAAMKKVHDAITDPNAVGFDFNVTKNLIAEYMTLRQEKQFYGDRNLDLIPSNYDSDKEFIEAGGSLGYAKSQGWKYVEKKQKVGKGKDAVMKSYMPTKQYEWVQTPQRGGTTVL